MRLGLKILLSTFYSACGMTINVLLIFTGYISVLGMSVEVDIVLKDNYFKFTVMGDLFGMFRVSLDVEATYGSVATLEAKVSMKYFFDNWARRFLWNI